MVFCGKIGEDRHNVNSEDYGKTEMIESFYGGLNLSV